MINEFKTLLALEDSDDEDPEKTVKPSEAHSHYDSQGVLHHCFHQCTNLVTDWKFWCGLTLGFPIEHWLWEKVWPFYVLTQSLGL